MQIGALGQGEQTRNPAQHGIALAACGLGQAARQRIETMLPAQILESRAMRALVGDAHDLVDELVRDLMLEHFAHHAPGLVVHQTARERQGAAATVPESQARTCLVQGKDRRSQTAAKMVAADLAPG